jgi:Ser/Thr protein kinase RdoA (MazF antagonist)
MTDAGRDAVQAAAAAFGLAPVGPGPVSAARGQQGIVWRVETAEQRFAVKQLLTPVAEPELEVAAVVVDAAIARGVEAPRPVRSGSGTLVVAVGGARFTCSSWVDLEEPRRDLDPDALGLVLARLHCDPLPGAEGPVDPWYVDPVPEPEWLELSRRLTAARAPFAAEFAAAAPWFCSLQEEFAAPGATQMCHRDLWADNLRRTGAGLCVIDGDNCGPAGPVQELAMLLVEYCRRDDDRAARLCRAYRRAGGGARPVDRGDFTMVLAQFGHIAATAADRWLAARDDAGRSRAEAWFRPGYDDPFGRAEMDDLLRAVRGI